MTSMTPLRSIKQIQQLNGCLATLNHFISRLAYKGLSFFKVLRGGKKFKWTKDCQHVLEELKRYLASPPLLTKPSPGDVLLLYLAISHESIRAVIVREGERGHQHIYYVVRALQGEEQRHSKMEKLTVALITAARKLKPYFQFHEIVVLTNYPLKQVPRSLETSGRLAKWAIELSEYGVEFCSRSTTKAQNLAVFLVEMTGYDSRSALLTWTINVDGSATSSGRGAGIVIVTPQGDELEYALRFDSQSRTTRLSTKPS